MQNQSSIYSVYAYTCTSDSAVCMYMYSCYIHAMSYGTPADTDDVFMVQTFSFDLYTREYFYSKCCQQLLQFCMKIERPCTMDR